MRLNLDRISKDSSCLLGPGKRILIWFHGCDRKCPGCIVEKHNTALNSQFSLSVAAVLGYIRADEGVEGVTISGGEPLLQMDALIELVGNLHVRNIGVILYSGYTLSEISNMEKGNELLNNLDTLIDGPYIRELNDNKAHRGSANQQIHHLTSRYISYYETENTARECVIVQNGSLLRLTGIPDAQSMALWNVLKEEESVYEIGK